MKMKNITVEKIVLNIGIGSEGDIKKAKQVLKYISGMEPVITTSKKRSTFNVPKGKVIGCKVTIRKNVNDVLKKLLGANENKISEKNFDSGGNFSFGIKEYIDIPGVEYDPNIGITGFDVAVRLQRPGFRVVRKQNSKKIGKKHRITTEEAIDFVKKEFEIEVF